MRQALREGGFYTLGDSSPDGVYAYDLDGRFVDANEVFFTRVGQSRDGMAAKPFSSSVAEQDKGTARANFEAASRGEVRTWQTSASSKSGDVRRLLTINLPFYSGGVCCAVLGIVRDLAFLEESQQHAMDLENRLAQTLDSMTDAIFFVDREWKFSYVNRRAEEMTGKRRSQLVGTSFWKLFPEAEGSEFGDGYRRVMNGAAREQRRGYKSMIGRWVDITAYSTAEGMAIYTRDVDAEEKARVAVDQSERRTITQAALLDAARDAMIVRQLDGTIAYWNRAAANLYGWSADEAVGVSERTLLYDNPLEYDAAHAGVLEDGYWFGTLRQTTREGRSVTVEGRWTLVSTPTGEPDSIFSVNSDITFQLQEERLRLRTQRMESLGLLAGGIAHDLNNVLTPILMSAQMLSAQTPVDRELVSGIERSALRGADLIRQVLAFARGADGILERVDVRKVLADLDSFCRETLPKNIGVTLDLAPNIPDVRGDSTQVMQVLINLLVNARDAMPKGGSLRITAFGTGDTPSGTGTVVIEVADDGTGMDDETLETIFDPFFTTKAAGSGTGLGLATSLSIAQRHGGSLTATSEVGSGTLLRLELPAFAPDPSLDLEVARVVAHPTASPRGADELVLVVDDDPTIRTVNCHALEAAGYRTVSAGNGEEGLAVFSEQDTPVRLVVTDLMMPILDGAAMARSLRARGYLGPILATSGGMRAGGPISGVDGTRFLGKPYTTHDFLRSVHELLVEFPIGS